MNVRRNFICGQGEVSICQITWKSIGHFYSNFIIIFQMFIIILFAARVTFAFFSCAQLHSNALKMPFHFIASNSGNLQPAPELGENKNSMLSSFWGLDWNNYIDNTMTPYGLIYTLTLTWGGWYWWESGLFRTQKCTIWVERGEKVCDLKDNWRIYIGWFF